MASDFPVFDSMKACSARCGIPLPILSEAKRAGCLAFEHGRVSLELLLPFLFAERGKVSELLDLTQERAGESRARKISIEHQNAIDAKTVIGAEDFVGYLRDTWQPCRECVIPMPDILSALCNPSDPEHARQHLLEWRDEFFKRCTLKLPHSEIVAASKSEQAPPPA